MAYAELISFLRNHDRAGSTALECTHTSMHPKIGMHIENTDKLASLIKAANREVRRQLKLGEMRIKRHCIVERPLRGPGAVSIFRIELDFKYPLSMKHRLYTLNDVVTIGKLAWEILDMYIDIRRRNKQLFLLEKDRPTLKTHDDSTNNKWSDGFKFMAPYVHVPNRLLLLVIHTMRVEAVKRNLLGGLMLTNRVSKRGVELEDVFDIGVVEQSGWNCYGGAKPEGLPYNLSTVYGYDMVPIDAEYSQDELVDLLSIRRSTKRDRTRYGDGIDDDVIDSALNAIGVKTRINHTEDKKSSLKHVLEKIDEQPDLPTDALAPEKKIEVDKARVFVQLLSPARAADYSEWLRVGWCLHNIHEMLLPEWTAFSKLAPSFKKGECAKLWTKMKYSGFGLSALRQWVIRDNPKEYKKYLASEIHDALRNAVSGNSFELATAVKNMYGPQYVSVNVLKDEWYVFNGHTYEPDDGHTLSLKLSTDVVNEFLLLSSYFSTKAVSCSGTEKELYLSKCTAINKIVTKLLNKKYPDEVVAQCRKLFYVPKFKELLDANPDTLGMADGVLDLKEGIMRDGTPDDYISMSTGHKYIKYDETNEGIRWVHNFMKQLQPNERIREYLWLLFASCLDGHNREEKFHLLTGKGCFSRGTKVLMANGARCTVESIKVGDHLMGWDSRFREVTRIFYDTGSMYKLTTPSRTLRISADHKIVMMMDDILAETNTTTGITTVVWIERQSTSDMPILKIKQLADGHDRTIGREFARLKRNHDVISGEVVVVTAEAFIEWPEAIRAKCFLMHGALDDTEMVYQSVPVSPTELGEQLAKSTYTVNGNRIPKEYINNTAEVRTELIHALICHLPSTTVDGVTPTGAATTTTVLMVANNPELVEDIVMLARSLGMGCVVTACTTDATVQLLDITTTATGLESFTIAEDGTDVFHGFELAIKYLDDTGAVKWDGDSDDAGKFFLADMTIASNSNGKSKLITLVQKALRDYATSVDPTLFTKKAKDAEGASPEKARLKGKRAVFSSESEEDDKLAMSVLKQFTGNDVITARPLYQSSFQFVLCSKFIFALNHLPYVKATDDASWRRLRVIEFKSKFCDNPDPKKNEFQIDSELQGKLDRYAPHMLSCLIHKYAAYRKLGKLRDIPEVMANTKKYRDDNDVIGEFFAELLEKRKKGKESIHNLLKTFQMWVKTAHSTATMPNKKEFQTYFEDQGLIVKCGHVYGIQMRDQDQDQGTDVD